MRAVDFTRVTLLKFVPDALSVLRPEVATRVQQVSPPRPQAVTSSLARSAPEAARRLWLLAAPKALAVAALQRPGRGPWAWALGAGLGRGPWAPPLATLPSCRTQAATAARFVPALRFMCVSSVSSVRVRVRVRVRVHVRVLSERRGAATLLALAG